MAAPATPTTSMSTVTALLASAGAATLLVPIPAVLWAALDGAVAAITEACARRASRARGAPRGSGAASDGEDGDGLVVGGWAWFSSASLRREKTISNGVRGTVSPKMMRMVSRRLSMPWRNWVVRSTLVNA